MTDAAESSWTLAHAKALAEALRKNPTDPKLLFQFCMTTGRLGACELEASVLGELVAREPPHPLLLAHYAQALDETERMRESMPVHERALALAPDSPAISATFGLALLRAGDLLRGWDFYEAREQIRNAVPQFTTAPSAPRYTGGNLHGRTIVAFGEQGFGDTIMFARYAPMLARRGARVVLLVNSGVNELVGSISGVWKVAKFGDRIPPFHAWTRLLSLPRIFATSLSTIPHDVPYLRAPAARLFPWRDKLAADATGANPAIRRVGLVWAGNPKHLRDIHRSIHLSDLAPLADVPNVQFYALQKGAREAEGSTPPAGMRIIDLAPQMKDLSDLAAIIQLLDLVITVDTAPAHLAGALAKPVWALIPFSPDWRWLLDREDSPWYPTMRLFRQPALRDWATPIARMRDALTAWASAPLPPRDVNRAHSES